MPKVDQSVMKFQRHYRIPYLLPLGTCALGLRQLYLCVHQLLCLSVCIYHEICCLSCLYVRGEGQLYLDLSLKGLLLVNYENGFLPATCS